jgi:WhiB family redox-sensing transcriptional regulator
MTAQSVMPIEPVISEDWQELGLCRQIDNEVFFVEKGGSTREAKKICSRCIVKEDCLQSAMDRDERFGVWGGASERERRKMKRANPKFPALTLVHSLEIAPMSVEEASEETIALTLLHAYLNERGIEDGDWRVRIINSLPVAAQDGTGLLYSLREVDTTIELELERMATLLEASIPLQRQSLAMERLNPNRAEFLRLRAIKNYQLAAENAPSEQGKAYWRNLATQAEYRT